MEDGLVRLLAKASILRLRDADALVCAWERAPTYVVPGDDGLAFRAFN